MTIVNTNVGSNVARAALASQNNDMQDAIRSLSTGLRINSASDDVAGMAISSRMESTIRGLSQAIRNSSDGKNMFDTVTTTKPSPTSLSVFGLGLYKACGSAGAVCGSS